MFDPKRFLSINLDETFKTINHTLEYDFSSVTADIDCQNYEKFISSSLKMLKDKSTLFTNYPSINGLLELRELITKKRFNNNVAPEKIWLTNGASGAFSLLCDIFLRPHDTVLVESYCYHGFLAELYRRKINVIHIVSDDKGISPEAIKKCVSHLKKNKISPKFIHLMPTLQNPTGQSLPLERRLQLLDVIQEIGMIIIENDSYADFSFSHQPLLPSLYELSDNDNIIYISSYTKLLGCSIRVGFLSARAIFKPVIDQMIYGRIPCQLSTICTYSYLKESYDEVVNKTAVILKKKRDAMIDSINLYCDQSITYNVPDGGMFLWAKLPENIDINKLRLLSLEKQLDFLPGNYFNRKKLASRHIRLVYSNKSTNSIHNGIKILGSLIEMIA